MIRVTWFVIGSNKRVILPKTNGANVSAIFVRRNIICEISATGALIFFHFVLKLPLQLQISQIHYIRLLRTCQKQQPDGFTSKPPGFLVEATGFEPAALCSQSRCATKLRYASLSLFRSERVYLILKLLSTLFLAFAPLFPLKLSPFCSILF